jgi:hypothetical protein
MDFRITDIEANTNREALSADNCSRGSTIIDNAYHAGLNSSKRSKHKVTINLTHLFLKQGSVYMHGSFAITDKR